MRLAASYALPEGFYYEWCSRADTPEEAANDIYPGVGCIHQGYSIPKEREVEETVGGKRVKRKVAVTEAEARAESLAQAEPFLLGELQRSIPMWEGAKVQEERRLRAQARQRVLEEKLLAEERARLKAVP